MSDLAKRKCIPCEDGQTRHLLAAEITNLLSELDHWEFEEFHHLAKTFTFKDFREALLFTNKVGEIAEAEGHHPDIYVTWGKVKIKIYTHSIDGLSENDFILAAKIDEIMLPD